MTQEKSSSIFSILQNDYAVWQSQVLLSIFYDALSYRKDIPHPQSFRDMADENIHVPNRVQDSQDLLHEMASRLLWSEGVPTREQVETFLQSYENFQSALQRLDQDSLLSDYGLDVTTGLYSSTAMMRDLERELERRDRRGQPFCIVLSRIDGEISRKSEENQILAARVIEKTIRSFDDAYVSGEGEFLVSLKHSDDKGGVKYVARLTKALQREEGITFTMSSYVAEPLPGDSILQLLHNLRQDLDKMVINEEKGGVGQYEDVSPLTRYVQSLKDDKKV